MKQLAAFALLLLATRALVVDPPMPFTGKVVKVTEGDTIQVLLDRETHKIRLLHIDAPESRQAFGTKAKQVLSEMVFGKELKVVWKERDHYKRILGDLYVGEQWVNLEMVKDGMAWHDKQYSRDEQMAKAEVEAREAKKGLWADPNPTPPWEFRRKKQ